MVYTCQIRYIPGYTGPIPLLKGKYKFTNDFYEVDRYPRVGENATAFFDYARQCGKPIKTTYETFIVE